MCGFHSIAFIEYMHAVKTLINYTNTNFLWMTIKSILRTNISSLEFKLNNR